MLPILTINLRMRLGYMQGGSPCTQDLSPDLWRPGQSVSETHICFHRVLVINHNATPRTSCFLWHLLFDKLKLTDTAERFITFSPLVCCMLTSLHNTLLCLYISLRIYYGYILFTIIPIYSVQLFYILKNIIWI